MISTLAMNLFVLLSIIGWPLATGIQLNCLLPLPEYMVSWQDGALTLQVSWDFSKVCHDTSTCYGQGLDSNVDIMHQLRPVLTQPQAVMTFTSTIQNLIYYETDDVGFKNCNFSASETTQIGGNPTLQIGGNYFIARSDTVTWMSCETGLRLNVTVQENNCGPITPYKTPCNSNGHCVAQPFESAHRCVCCQTHYGEFCDKRDGCFPNKLACLNGGTCIDGPDINSDTSSFTCKCIGGFTGIYCQSKNTEVCPRNECSNGGECKLNSDAIRGFTCTCPAGFHGEFCEEDVNECQSSPCLNSATCVDGPNMFSCTCLEGFNGVRCERDERTCRPGVCYNGATCSVEDGKAKCECKIGFAGPTCMTEVRTCEENPCSQHSLDCVVDSNNNFHCVCTPGFTGQTCHIDIDECASNPCLNGTCIDKIAGYQCRCSDGSLSSSNCLFKGATKLDALDSVTIAPNLSEPSSTSSSSSTGVMNLVVGVVVILALVAMLVLLVVFFARSGIWRGRKRRIYAIEISNLSLEDRINASMDPPKEFFGDDDYPEVRSCLSPKNQLFKRSKKKERF